MLNNPAEAVKNQIAVGARLELALGEELIKVQLEWRAFGRAVARLLGREDEFDAYIQREADYFPLDWVRHHHDNVYMLAYYIQHHESHPYVEK